MPKKYSANFVVLTSFFVDFLDIVINIVVMLITGSVVMLAELLQGVADLISSGFLLVGLKRPRKEVYLWARLSALTMLLVASSLSFYFGLTRLLNPEGIENIYLAYGALVIGASSNGYAFYVSVKRLLDGKNVSKLIKVFSKSSHLMTKNTFVLDLMGMSAALLGFVALALYQLTGEIRFDGLGAMVIGIVLALLSIDLFLDINTAQRKKTGER